MEKDVLLKNKDLFESLERNLYFLKFDKLKQLESNKSDDLLKTQNDYILSLKNFNSISISLLEKCFNKKIKKRNYKIFNYYTEHYLKIILSICNFILKKAYEDDPYNLSIIHSKLFLEENQDLYINFKNNINLQLIKNRIIDYYNRLNIGQDFFNKYIKNWLDDFCKTKSTINTFNKIEKEPSFFLRFFKYLKINSLILTCYINKIEEIQVFLKNNKLKNKINYLCFKENNKNFAKLNLSQTLSSLGVELLNNIIQRGNYINNLQSKRIEYKTKVIFSYYFDENKNDYVETNSNDNFSYFIRSKLYHIDSFINNCVNNNIDKIILMPNKNKNNKGNLNFIIKLFWAHCTRWKNNIQYFYDQESLYIEFGVNSNIKIPLKDLPFSNNVISSYLEETAESFLEPQYNNFLNMIRLKYKRFFYDFIYPIINFNFDLHCIYNNFRYFELYNYEIKYKKKHVKSLFHYSNYSLSKRLLKDKNYTYNNYVDFSELVQTIIEMNFHNNKNINIFIRNKVIDYLINHSLIHKFIHYLLDIISMNIFSHNQLKKYKFKIKVLKNNEKYVSYFNYKIDNPYSNITQENAKKIKADDNKSKSNKINKSRIFPSIKTFNLIEMINSLFSIIKIEKKREKTIGQIHEIYLIELRQNDISKYLETLANKIIQKKYYHYYKYNEELIKMHILSNVLFEGRSHYNWHKEMIIIDKLLNNFIHTFPINQ